MKKPRKHKGCSFLCLIIRMGRKQRIKPEIHICINGNLETKEINPEQKTTCYYNDNLGVRLL